VGRDADRLGGGGSGLNRLNEKMVHDEDKERKGERKERKRKRTLTHDTRPHQNFQKNAVRCRRHLAVSSLGETTKHNNVD